VHNDLQRCTKSPVPTILLRINSSFCSLVRAEPATEGMTIPFNPHSERPSPRFSPIDRIRRASYVPCKLKISRGTPHTILFIMTLKGREFSDDRHAAIDGRASQTFRSNVKLDRSLGSVYPAMAEILGSCALDAIDK